eukprot:TRINITY_DN114314_c0_g1_i1.p1 TRINITY_DN114314_c0_g1~~TRINITY_DN114314_c0_g1_i1.p1  ORF type:complete len:463 (-),score=4.29 TRINITY_DN114314_c0_g1_i1:408-1796(-)
MSPSRKIYTVLLLLFIASMGIVVLISPATSTMLPEAATALAIPQRPTHKAYHNESEPHIHALDVSSHEASDPPLQVPHLSEAATFLTSPPPACIKARDALSRPPNRTHTMVKLHALAVECSWSFGPAEVTSTPTNSDQQQGGGKPTTSESMPLHHTGEIPKGFERIWYKIPSTGTVFPLLHRTEVLPLQLKGIQKRSIAFLPSEPRFLYLTQTDHHLNSSMVQSIPGDLLCITYKQPTPNCAFFPGSTWTSGRNKLLGLAKTLPLYDWYTFLDDDVSFKKANFSWLQYYTSKFQPAVATPILEWTRSSQTLGHLEAQTVTNFDAIVNTFQLGVVKSGLVLPYYDGEDQMSWWHSQIPVMIISIHLFPERVMEINKVKVRNAKHREYPRDSNISSIMVAPCQYEIFKSLEDLHVPQLGEKQHRVDSWRRGRPAMHLPKYHLIDAFKLNSTYWQRVREILMQPP